MKDKYWKYICLTLSIVSVALLVYTVVFPDISNGTTITRQTRMIPEGYSDEDKVIVKADELSSYITAPIGAGLEVEQNQFTAGLIIADLTEKCYGQTIDLGAERHVNGFQLGIARHGSPTDGVEVALSKKDSFYGLGGKWTMIYADDLPEADTVYWVGKYFVSDPYIDDDIVLAAVSEDVYDDDYWMWAFSDENPYSDGRMIKTNSGWEWTYPSTLASYDGTFQVYTEEASPDPQISISINYSVLQIAGWITLLGAALSGVKYVSVIGWI